MQEFINTTWKMIVDSQILSLLAALIILLVGWIVSMFFKKMVYSILLKIKISEKLAVCMPPDELGAGKLNLEKIGAGIIFWILFLLTIIAALTSLNLDQAAQPIRAFLDKIIAYLPNLIAAALLGLIAWIAASLLRYLALTAMSVLRLDERIEKQVDTDGQECKLSFTIASVLYWIVYLCFVPAVLKALQIEGITAPLESMLQKIFAYLPNLAAAAFIAIIGFFFAGVLRKISIKLIQSLKLDLWTQKQDISNAFEFKNAANLVGIVVYILIAIPVIIAALSALQIKSLTASVTIFFDHILGATGNIIAAVLILFIAWLIGKFVSKLLVQLLEGFGVNKLPQILGFTKEEPKNDSSSLSSFIGKLVFVAIVYFAFIGALEMLQLTKLANLASEFVPFAGKLIIAAIVFLIGVYLANMAVAAIHATSLESKFAVVITRGIILFFSGALALQSTDIGEPIVQMAFTLILGAFAVASAIAFGIGGRDFAARKLEEWTGKKKDDSDK